VLGKRNGIDAGFMEVLLSTPVVWAKSGIKFGV
jgi:hypothetical protein